MTLLEPQKQHYGEKYLVLSGRLVEKIALCISGVSKNFLMGEEMNVSFETTKKVQKATPTR